MQQQMTRWRHHLRPSLLPGPPRCVQTPARSSRRPPAPCTHQDVSTRRAAPGRCCPAAQMHLQAPAGFRNSRSRAGHLNGWHEGFSRLRWWASALQPLKSPAMPALRDRLGNPRQGCRLRQPAVHLSAAEQPENRAYAWNRKHSLQQAAGWAQQLQNRS